MDESKKSGTLIKVGAVFIFVANIYALITHSMSELIRISLYIAIPFAIIVAIVGIVNWSASKFRTLQMPDYRYIVISVFAALLIGLFYAGVWVLLKDIYWWVQRPSVPSIRAALIVIIVTLGLGILLFNFRLRYRSLYGFHEALAGLVIAVNKTLTQNEVDSITGFYVALLTACIYLVVRGLDNIHQGLTKDPVDPIGYRIFQQIKRVIDEINKKD